WPIGWPWDARRTTTNGWTRRNTSSISENRTRRRIKKGTRTSPAGPASASRSSSAACSATSTDPSPRPGCENDDQSLGGPEFPPPIPEVCFVRLRFPGAGRSLHAIVRRRSGQPARSQGTALSGTRQTRDLHVHGGGSVARRYVRLQ